MRCQLIKKNQRLGKKRTCKYKEGAQMKEDKTISAKNKNENRKCDCIRQNKKAIEPENISPLMETKE